MADRSTAFRVTEGVPLSSDLGFLAQTVIVDNLCASWFVIDAAGRFVPPFTYGATFPLGPGVQIAQGAWRTPPGMTPPTPSGGQAQVTYTSAALTPSNGQQVVVPSQQVVCALSNLDALSGGWTTGGGTASLSPITAPTKLTFNSNTATSGSLTLIVNIPAGANGIILTGVFGYASGGVTFPTGSLSVVGVQTGTRYYVTPASNSQPTPPFFAVIASAEDQQVQITLEVSGGGGGNSFSGTLEVVATFGTTTVAVEGGANPVPVTIAQTVVPTENVVMGTPFTQNSAANTTQTFNIPSTPLGSTATARLSQLTLSFTGTPGANVFVAVRDGSANNLWVAFVPAVAAGVGPWPFHFNPPIVNPNSIGLSNATQLSVFVTAAGAGIISTISGVYEIF